MLRNLNALAVASRENFQQTFVNEDFQLNREFKERLEEVLESKNMRIQYFSYSAEITTSSNMKIFCPNQWFYLATFVVEFVSELIEYKSVLENLSETNIDGMSRRVFMDKIKSLKVNNDIDTVAPEIKEEIFNYYNDDAESADNLCRFITDYSWWFGSKTIDRTDYYVSPVLNLLGLVNVSQAYVAEIALYLAADAQLMSSAINLRQEEFITRDLTSATNLIVYGAPGTGKSNYLEENFPNATRVVFHSDYSYYDFVGNYKPVPLYRELNVPIHRLNGEEFQNGEPIIDYQYVPGPFIKVLIESIRDGGNQYTLLIEEINRSNAPAVFGDTFQLLDRTTEGNSRYRIYPNEDLQNYLTSLQDVGHYFRDGLYIPHNMNIVATMNSADQGVFVLDSAFKRRWKFKYMPIKESGFVHENTLVDYARQRFKWRHILTSVNKKLKNIGINEDRLIGPYFISPEEINDTNNISSKLLIYLWDDVLRYNRDKFFDETIKTYSELVTGFNNGTDVLNIMDDITQLEEEQRELEQTDEEGQEEN